MKLVDKYLDLFLQNFKLLGICAQYNYYNLITIKNIYKNTRSISFVLITESEFT